MPERLCSEYLNWLYRADGRTAVGFKLMLNQCEDRPYLWSLVVAFPIRCMLVTRRNVLKTLVSRRTAAESGVYHVSATLPVKSAVANWVPRRIAIDAATVVADLDAIAGEAVKWRERLRAIPTIEIEYESYVREQDAWNERVLAFLEVPPHVLSSDLRKVNPDRLQDLIANYEEVAAAVERSRHADCLAEDR
jgi:hypothetical protein